MPNSVTRWATVIEKVLKIRNAPTKIATKREDQQEDLQEAEVVADFFRAAVGVFLGGLDPHAGGISRAIRRFSAVAETPLGRGDRDLVEAADLVGDPLRLGQRHLGDAARRRRRRCRAW